MSNLDVRVQPRSSRNQVALVGDVVKVWLTAPPTDGQANAALLALLADRLAIPKSNVEVIRGHTSRNKTVRIDGLSADEIRARLSLT